MLTSNMTGRKGGAITLIVKSHLKVKQIGVGQLRSFQFCKWQVQIHHTIITLVSIYHPPYNNKTKITNAEFLDEYTHWIAETSANDKSLLICGDYNLHVNNPNDEDAANFLGDKYSIRSQTTSEICNTHIREYTRSHFHRGQW